MKRFIISLLITIPIISFLLPSQASAEKVDGEVKYKARIIELEKAICPDKLAEGDCYFFKLEIIEGDKSGQQVESTMPTTDNPKLETINYKTGQEVYVVETQVADDVQYYLKEPIRKKSSIILVIIFIILVVLIGGLQGFSSLIGLIISFVIIFAVVIPMMLSGTNPVLASIVGGILIMTTSIYLSHGFNKKTTLALVGTSISLVITALLALVFTQMSQLTGFATDESTFLLQLIDKPLNMEGILLASIIIGAIGILDDITVSQVSLIQELFKTDPSLSARELLGKSMKVGRDHIASMVNTLVLAYTGAALPLILLFVASGAGFEEITNTELVAEEIVRTLVGSIGLVLAVPITTIIAVLFFTRDSKQIPIRRR